jgi:cystathionine beta-lyase/cystathionine gamma-synthase
MSKRRDQSAGRRTRKSPAAKKFYGFGTNAVHGGEEEMLSCKPSSTPIYQTSTFFFDDIEEAFGIGQGTREGFIYTRLGNPTVRAFEDKMALLEGGESAVAFASGMGAVAAVFQELLKPGDEVISSSRVYAGTRSYYREILGDLGCSVNYFEPEDDLEKKVPSLITGKTKVIFFESPSNPELSIIDMALIARLARRHGLVSVIDNTFATPYLQRPLLTGIDCVVHSATKYIGGHGDAIGGVVVGPAAFVSRLKERMLVYLGACLSPFNAWLFLRGLRSLHVRMDRHCSSAALVAGFLSDHPKVTEVLYPGLKSHRGHRAAKAQMSGFGGMVSFSLRSRSACRRFFRALRLCRIGVSLGDTETIALNYALMFHPDKTDAACRRIGVDPMLIRISIGLEDPEDIVEDLKSALEAV